MGLIELIFGSAPPRAKTVKTCRFWHERDHCGVVMRTWAVLWVDDYRFVGIANVHPGDQFSRRKGRLIAEGRARKICSTRQYGIGHRFAFTVDHEPMFLSMGHHTTRDVELFEHLMRYAPTSLWRHG